MRKPVDIESQFKKLCPFERTGDVSTEVMLKAVNGAVRSQVSLGHRNHWAYDLNRHQALIELRDALKAEMSHAD